MSTALMSKEHATQTRKAEMVDMKLEVVVIPVSDVDRAKQFYLSLGIEWRPAKSTTLPYDLPGAVYDVDFMVKDSKRFADSGGWGYAVFVHDVASKMYKPGTLAHQPPQGNDAKCGAACHTIVKTKDYVFTEYAKR